MNRAEAIAEGILSTKQSFARYLVGFDDSNATRQAPGLPNHAIWSLGHCALTMHRVAANFDGLPLPDADFVVGHSSGGGNARQFATESVAFGSRPVDSPKDYPALARGIEIYNAACDRLAAAVKSVPDARLDDTVLWGPMTLPLYLLALRMIGHNGMHTGQNADLRRSLGFKSVFS
jgi:hypothetical protein